jgi:hypothetical protein
MLRDRWGSALGGRRHRFLGGAPQSSPAARLATPRRSYRRRVRPPTSGDRAAPVRACILGRAQTLSPHRTPAGLPRQPPRVHSTDDPFWSAPMRRPQSAPDIRRPGIRHPPMSRGLGCDGRRSVVLPRSTSVVRGGLRPAHTTRSGFGRRRRPVAVDKTYTDRPVQLVRY